ncbi:MAG TPA: c-type cytochrome [Verrucomicrobiae bacterium]|nr:c-type cytochrome [Verrucomicrobiae bacterium]
MLRGVILGVLVGIVLVFFGVYFYFAGGHAPVATKGPEMPFEHKLAHMAQDAYFAKLPHTPAPVPEDETTYLAGAKVYKEHCAVCHGLPGEPKTAIADGMFPAPPQLFRGTGVTDDEAWETYWKVSGGLRMTGMPAFADHLGETKMWQVSVLLKNADKISDAVKKELASGSTPASATPTVPAPQVNAPAALAPATPAPAPPK